MSPCHCKAIGSHFTAINLTSFHLENVRHMQAKGDNRESGGILFCAQNEAWHIALLSS